MKTSHQKKTVNKHVMNQNTLTEQLLLLKKTTSRNTVAWKDKTRQQGEIKDELT